MSKTEITIKVEVTDDLLAGALVTAVEGGISYWADIEEYECEGFFDGSPGTVRAAITDRYDDTGVIWEVSPADIAVGLERLLDGTVAVNDTIRGWIWQELCGNIGSIDADAADCVVQAALFGEVRYG